MSYQRHHILLSYFKTLSAGPILGLNPWPAAKPSGTLKHEPLNEARLSTCHGDQNVCNLDCCLAEQGLLQNSKTDSVFYWMCSLLNPLSLMMWKRRSPNELKRFLKIFQTSMRRFKRKSLCVFFLCTCFLLLRFVLRTKLFLQAAKSVIRL